MATNRSATSTAAGQVSGRLDGGLAASGTGTRMADLVRARAVSRFAQSAVLAGCNGIAEPAEMLPSGLSDACRPNRAHARVRQASDNASHVEILSPSPRH